MAWEGGQLDLYICVGKTRPGAHPAGISGACGSRVAICTNVGHVKSGLKCNLLNVMPLGTQF